MTNYPLWEPAIQAVLSESDIKQLQKNIFLAEDAMVKRLQELNGSDHHEERRAIDDAMKALVNVMEEKLNYPKFSAAGRL